MADPEKLVRAVERDRGLMETFLDFVRGLKNRIAIRLRDVYKRQQFTHRPFWK